MGKSTLAVRLVEALNAADPGIAAYVPMDGFHMRHSTLEHLGTVKDKGALRAHFERLATDDLVRIVPGHGDLIETDAAQLLRQVAATL